MPYIRHRVSSFPTNRARYSKGLCPQIGIETKEEGTYRSWLTLANSALFCGLHWILNEAVSTNCPTVALKPDRKALKGCFACQHSLSEPHPFFSHAVRCPDPRLVLSLVACLISRILLRLSSQPQKSPCWYEKADHGNRKKKEKDKLTKFPPKTAYRNCNAPTTTKNPMNVSISFTRCGVSRI